MTTHDGWRTLWPSDPPRRRNIAAELAHWRIYVIPAVLYQAGPR